MAGYKSKLRVLVVDDERLIADTLKEILELHGFDATPLYSGESALEWIETYRPDIVLSDIVMHQVDGVEAAVRIRALHPECRVILFSASAPTAANRHRMSCLGFEYLDRPLHPTDLLARVIGTRPQGMSPLAREESNAT